MKQTRKCYKPHEKQITVEESAGSGDKGWPQFKAN